MEKIEITVCTGTTCYVMGAGDLLVLQEELDTFWPGRISFKGSGCLGLCKEGQYGKAPFVKIDQFLISEATPSKIREALKAIIETAV